MSESNVTKIQELKNGALITTVPRALAQALNWKKGTHIEWKFDSERRLYIERQD